MNSLLRSLNTTQHREFSINKITNTEDTNREYANGQFYFTRGPSLAQATISRYNDGTNNNKNNYNDSKLDTRTYPNTGLQYIYAKLRNSLSRYPLGFPGWYNCGAITHRNIRDCNQATDENKFFAELWAHKPHTKRSDLHVIRSNNNMKGDINITNRGEFDNN